MSDDNATSAEMIRQIIDGSLASIYVCDAQTYELLFVNATAAKTCGKTVAEAGGTTCYQYFKNTDKPCADCHMHSATFDYCELEHTNEATGKHYLSRSRLIDWGGRRAFIEYLTDETKRMTEQRTLEGLVNGLPGGAGIFNVYADGTPEVVYLNDGYHAMLNDSRENRRRYYGMSVIKAVHAEDRPLLISELLSAMEENRMINCEIRVLTGADEYKWLNVRADIAERTDEKCTVYASFTDIDELKRSRTQLTDLISNVECGLIIGRVNERGEHVIEYINEGYAALCEQNANELFENYENDIVSGIHPDDCEMVNAQLNKFMEDHKDYEITYRYITPANKLKWINVKTRVVEHADGTVTSYATCIDVTEQHQLQKRLIDLINTVPCGICMYRWDGRHMQPLIVNARYLEMVGEDELRDLESDDQLPKLHAHPDDAEEFKRVCMNALKNAERLEHAYRSVNAKTGECLWVRMRAASMPQPDGSMLIYVCYTDITSERIAENMLRQSEQALEFATEQAGLWYWRYDLIKDIAYMDIRNQREYELPPVMENFIETWLSMGYVHADYVDIYRDAYTRVKNGENRVSFEVKMRLRDGSEHWWRYYVTRLRGMGEESNLAVCTAMIIDAEKELEVKYELEQNKKFLAEDNLVAFARFNLTTGETLEYVYREGEQMPQGETMLYADSGENSDEFVADEADRQRFRELNDVNYLLDCFSKGETEFRVDYRRRAPDGSVSWARNVLHLMRDPRGSDILLFEYRYDIDEEKNLELAYQSLADNNYDYVMRVNAREEQFFMLPGDKLDPSQPRRGEYTDDVIAEMAMASYASEDVSTVVENMRISGIRQNLKDKERHQFICRVPQADGSPRYKKITEYYLDREREIVIVTREDVTLLVLEEAKKNEILADALNAAQQASHAKTQFLSRMSHELRTPMNAIIGLSALAAGEVNDPKAMEDAISKIGLSARYLLSIINDILEMSRIESGRMSLTEAPFDFERLVSSVNAIIFEQAADKGVDYDAVVNSYMESSYVGDMTKLQQILINVLGNAVKFTPAGGKITFAMEQLRREDKRVMLRFVVSDTGIGIDKAFLPYLFEPFAQENSNLAGSSTGTGLGLAITKNIVDMMNGQISVQSVKNVGSVFTIEVQLGVSEHSRRYQEVAALMNLSRIRALVVDDDIIVCQTTEKILSSMGIFAEWADSGYAAVARVTERHKEKRDFDTVFIDWKMPDMDGVETARRIRHIVGPETTIIIITAYDWHTIEAQAREAGVDMFMEKPLFPSSIMSVFEALYSSRDERKEDMLDYDFAGTRILLAEDQPLNVEVAQRLLERVGAEVVVAANGLEALETFATAENDYFDAILMDIRMPVMDGLTATKNIRKLKKTGSRDIPIIAMTANAFDEDVETSLSSGMNAHLAKPIEPRVLFSTLSRLMRK